jgi:hypothetical protein
VLGWRPAKVASIMHGAISAPPPEQLPLLDLTRDDYEQGSASDPES